MGVQHLLAVWNALDLRRRVIVAAAALATFGAVLAMSMTAGRPSLALLYAGLDGAGAGEVLTALDQRGATYEVRGDAIYVDTALRDSLRMSLAADGLPSTGGTGYELLDSLSGFGTTTQMFDVAYWRAKEGELARTIAASPGVRAARVHISNQEVRGFRAASRPKASVSITTSGVGLTAAHAKALRYLVASAVSGMTPEDVSVIDSERGLVLSEDAGAADGSEGRSVELRRGVERLLEARVGPGNAVVEVSLDTVTESEAITERSFDPESRVAISTDTEERTSSSNDTRGSAVTVASNLPDGDAAGSDGASQSQDSETRERVNFEVSETTREVVRAPGAVRRLTVAVLVDGIEAVNEAGETTWSPRPAEELEALRGLVASAVGFDEERGDVITIQSLQFEQVVAEGEAATGGILSGVAFDVMSLVQLAVLAIVALVLGLFVVRPILTRTPAQVPMLPPARTATSSGDVLTGEIADGDFTSDGMAIIPGFAPSVAGIDGASAVSGSEDPVARLRRLIAEKRPETVDLLRAWIAEPGGERA
jgi:flagellar M-ring protein FliF